MRLRHSVFALFASSLLALPVAGCFSAGESAEDVPTAEGSLTLCVTTPPPFTVCGAQSTNDASVTVDDTTTDTRSATSYGSTACPSKFVVDVDANERNWESIKLGTILATDECGCGDYEGYLRVSGGAVMSYVCLALGCSPCGEGCGQYYPLYAPHEVTVTGTARWSSLMQACVLTLSVPRYLDGTPGVHEPHFMGDVQVQAEVRSKTTSAHKPVSVLVYPETD